MNRVLSFQILVLCILATACNSYSAAREIVTSSPTLPIASTSTNTPTITNTPTLAPTPSITPAVTIKPELHRLALNEHNIDISENLARFDTSDEACLISSQVDSALTIRLINGQPEYLLATKDFETQDIQIWNIGTQKIIQTIDDKLADGVLFAPDQRTLITSSSNGPATLTLWDIQSGNQRYKFNLQADQSSDERINISPNGLRIALFLALRVSEFNLQTGQVSKINYDFPLYGETPPPRIYSSDENLLAITYDKDNRLHLLDLTNNKDTILQFPFSNIDEVANAEAIISTIAMSANGKYLVGGALSGDIYLWDVNNGILLRTIKAHTTQRTDGWLGGIKILEFASKSNLLLSIGYDGFAKLWDVTTGRLLKKTDSCPHFGGFTQDGRYMVTVGKRGIELWGIP